MKILIVLIAIICLEVSSTLSASSATNKAHPTGLSVTKFADDRPRPNPKAMRTFSEKWAVVIGIDDFESSDADVESEYHWHLKYGKDDANAFHRYLVTKAHFEKDHCKVLLNRQATKTAIQDAFDWLSRQAKEDDLGVVYFRTRGVRDDTDENGSIARLEGLTSREMLFHTFLAATDSRKQDLADTAFDMDTLLLKLCPKLNAKGIVIIVDADFASNISNTIFPRGSGLKLHSGQTLNVICSSGTNELAWESETMKHSVFTSRLLDALNAYPVDTSLISVASALAKETNEDVGKIRVGRLQNPWTVGVSQWSQSSIIISDPLLTKPASKSTKPNRPN